LIAVVIASNGGRDVQRVDIEQKEAACGINIKLIAIGARGDVNHLLPRARGRPIGRGKDGLALKGPIGNVYDPHLIALEEKTSAKF